MVWEGVLFSLLWHHVSPWCLDLSTVLLKDRYLRNHVIAETIVPSVFDCAVSCQSIYGCRSFGFKPETDACHLHSEDTVSASMDLIGEEKWNHGDIRSFPSELWGPCRYHNCTAGQRCCVHRVTKSSYCSKVDLDLDLPDDHCPLLEVTNAIRRGGQTVGSTRTYTCLEGYLDTESFLTSAGTTCLSNHTWAPLSLTCTGPFVKITQHSGHKEVFEMIEERTLRRITGNSSSIIFWVKACRDSNFLLCGTNRQKDCYNVVIGGYTNTKNAIRRLEANTRVVREDDILSCTEFRPFWISWQDRRMRQGRGGTVGSRVSIEMKSSQLVHIKTVQYSCFTLNEAVWFFLLQN